MRGTRRREEDRTDRDGLGGQDGTSWDVTGRKEEVKVESGRGGQEDVSDERVKGREGMTGGEGLGRKGESRAGRSGVGVGGRRPENWRPCE